MGEWSVLEAKVARLEQQVSRLARVLSPSGGLAPDIFDGMSAFFSVLPHDAASMFQAANVTVGTGSTVTITYDANSGATWSHGIEIDPSSGFIRVHGANNGNVLLLLAFGNWAGNSSGIRDIKLRTDDGSERVNRQLPSGTSAVYSEITHIRRTKTETTEYRLDAFQDSGGNLDITSVGLVVVRLR